MTTDCKHARIQTWRFEEDGEAAGLWSCAVCGRRFEPLTVAQSATDAQISAAIAAERERCAVQLDALGCDHCAAAIRAGG